MTIWTIGHSILAGADFLERLTAHGIRAVADVRRHPASRRHPQFGRERLAASLAGAGVAYAHLEALGGRREPTDSDANAGLRDPAFRGYADYMATEAFEGGVRELLALAAGQPTAVMCAEADPGDCHRRLLADALVARGVEVRHIRDALTPPQPHEVTPGAEVRRGLVVYPKRETRPRAGR